MSTPEAVRVDEPTGGPGQEAAPYAALEQFQAARDLVLGVLGDGRQLAQALGPLAGQLESRFQEAARAVDASRLNLVVIGPEGSGKSTLINAITGTDVTPRESTHPGTVAPVFLQWSDDERPNYSVTLAESAGERSCASGEEFGRYILQRHNEHNEKGVLAGYVRWNHPLLERGLVLVDMPGVEGVSPEVALHAQEFIKNQAHAVLGVVRDRSYAPLLRIARRLARGNLRIQALVSNWSLDAWSIPGEEELAGFVATQQKIVTDFLRQADADIDVDEDDVYVLHLPSVCDRSLGKPSNVTSATHEREWARFEQAVWDYVRDHGVVEIVRRATVLAERALTELDTLLGARHGVLQALIDGDDTAGAGIADQFRAGRALAESAWALAYEPKAVDAVAAEHWGAIRLRAETTRNQIQDRIRALETRVRAHEGRLRKPEANDLWSQLCEDIGELRAPLAETEDHLVDEIIGYFCGRANAALDELFEAVPIVRAAVPAGFGDMTPGELVALELRQVEEEERERLLRHPYVDKASGFLFGPIQGLVLKALLKGALAATAWWESVREGERPALLASLAKAREQVLALETSESGQLRRAWGEAVERAADGVDRYLRARVAQVEGIVEDPRASLEVLVGERDRVQHTRSLVTLLRDRLEEVAG